MRGRAGRQEGGGREEERNERRHRQPVSDTDINREEGRQCRKHADGRLGVAEVGGATANGGFLIIKSEPPWPLPTSDMPPACFLGSLAETYGHRGQCHTNTDEH